MQIVIDIKDKEYKKLVNPYQFNEYLCSKLKEIVRNGTPLPKEHGRLIDADKLQHEINNDKREAFSKHEVWLLLSTYNDNLLTIIEAEKKVRNKKCR